MSLARDKGRRGEYQFAKIIGGARQPLSGAIDGTNDIIPPELYAGWAIEIKVRKKLPNLLVAALAQAEAAARGSGKRPLVGYKEDRGRFMVAMYAEDFVQFFKALAEVGNGYALKSHIRSLRRGLDEMERML